MQKLYVEGNKLGNVVKYCAASYLCIYLCRCMLFSVNRRICTYSK